MWIQFMHGEIFGTDNETDDDVAPDDAETPVELAAVEDDPKPAKAPAKRRSATVAHSEDDAGYSHSEDDQDDALADAE